jgi:hypothetical protein
MYGQVFRTISVLMTSRIDSVSSRQRLRPRREPYWHRVTKGCYLGVRTMSNDSEGSWVARAAGETPGKQVYKALSEFSEHPAHERFDLAMKAAREWFEHLGRGGSSEELTVAAACREYVSHLKSEGRHDAAKDAEGRFNRWVYSSKVGSTLLLKLSPKAVAAWRTTLAETPAIPQDKRKVGTKTRSGSSLNRDMTALRAALNFARENGHATTDEPWRSKLKPIANVDGRRDVYLDADQRRKLIEAAPTDVAALLRALSLVPLRPGAIAALTAGSFDKRLSTLTIGKDKAGADRKITLPKGTAAFFADQGRRDCRQAAHGDDRLCTSAQRDHGSDCAAQAGHAHRCAALRNEPANDRAALRTLTSRARGERACEAGALKDRSVSVKR